MEYLKQKLLMMVRHNLDMLGDLHFLWKRSVLQHRMKIFLVEEDKEGFVDQELEQKGTVHLKAFFFFFVCVSF